MNNDRFLLSIARRLCDKDVWTVYFNLNDFSCKPFLICAILLSTINFSYSQCSLFCKNQVNVSLGQDCEAIVTPEMVLNNVTTNCSGGIFSVELESSTGIILGSPMVNLTNAGQTFSAHVTDSNSGNSCWGYITVEYKLAPLIDCPPDVIIPCGGLDILTLPNASAQCGGGTFEVFLLNEERVTLNCDPSYTQKITRTYRAEDSFGNFTDCTHDIYLERVDLTGIIFPDNACISCGDPNYQFDTNGVPLPWISGAVPTGSGSPGVPIICIPNISGLASFGYAFPLCGSGSSAVPFIPNSGATIATTNGHDVISSQANLLCNSAIIYTDIEIPSTSCRKKIMRTWEIREWWCSGESSRSNTHLIEVKDDTPPEITCPADFTASSDEDCEVMVQLPAATVSDACSNGTIVQVDTGNGIIQSNGGIGMLETGINVVTYMVNDSCYNSASCDVTITVSDNVEPVAICESHMVVSLTNSQNTYLFASALDDGSWDGCGIDRFEVRRMTTDCDPTDLVFGDKVALCCTDSNTEVMVVFRVYDLSGNFNDCMVTVDVQNKLNAAVECPLDMTVDCRAPYDPNNLSIAFGEYKIIGDCSLSNNINEIVDNNVNQCGIGTITRTFQLLDVQNNIVSTCKQLITINDTSPFTLAMINWPDMYTVNSGVCSVSSLDPDDLMAPHNYPEFLGGNDQCSLLGYNYEDEVIQGSTVGHCFTIRRTWTVINWCDQSTGSFAIFTDPLGPQIIEVYNSSGITLDSNDPVEVPFSGADCTGGLVTYSRSATGDCSPLVWNYYLYDVNGVYLGIANDTSVFNETLSPGEYIVRWIVQDQCRNNISQDQELTVISTKTPTPVCISNLTGELNTPIDTDGDGINDQETLELWASDFDGGSYHTCNNPIALSMTPDIADTNITFDCSDIGMNEVNLYVTDLITGAQDFCTFFIEITDGGICGDNLRVLVEGQIFTEELENIEKVEVGLEGGDIEEVTDDNGSYAFDDMPTGGSYQVVPTRDDDHLNGVSTLDIIWMQRHILGVEELDSPYKLLAADVNNNQYISAIDMIELRKLILGHYDELPENTSWRFVDADFEFEDNYDPWTSVLPESYVINDLQTDMSIDFIGVKVGDVNSTVITNYNNTPIDNRSSRWPLVFNFNDEVILKGQSKTIEISAENYERITGWQCTFEFSSDKINISAIEGKSVLLEQHNYNISKQEEGWIALSYSQESELDLNNGDVIFEIEIEAKEDCSISEILTVSSKVTAAEAYRGIHETVNLELREAQSQELQIVKAKPNPFKAFTELEIQIPIAGEATLDFFNMNGQIIHSKNQYFVKGSHSVKVDRSDLSQSGVYYVKLTTGNVSTEYKLILID